MFEANIVRIARGGEEINTGIVSKLFRLIIGVSFVLSALLPVSCFNDDESTPMPTNQNSVLISYQRTGGFAGLRDQLTIYSNGRSELQRKGVEGEFTIQPSQLAHLKELMEEANFLGLKEEYLPTNIGADFFEYVISYQAEEGKMHSVRTMTGAVPDALQPILNELNQLISSNS